MSASTLGKRDSTSRHGPHRSPRLHPLPLTSARPLQAGSVESGSRHTAPIPPAGPSLPAPPRPPATLTLLLRRRHGAPALAPRAAAGLLGGAALWLQVLGGWGSWLWGSRVLPGGLVDFGDLLREAGDVSIFTGRRRSTEMREKSCRPHASDQSGTGARKRQQQQAQGTQAEGQKGRSL